MDEAQQPLQTNLELYEQEGDLEGMKIYEPLVELAFKARSVEELERIVEERERRMTSPTFLDDGRAVLHVGQGEGFIDVTLQLARVWRRELKPNEMRIAGRWAEWVTGKPLRGGVWESSHEDAFVRALGRVCWEGHMDAKAANTSRLFRKAYPILADSPFNIELDEEMRALLRSMFGA